MADRLDKEEFKEKLQYGDEEWEYFAANGTAPCPYGCIMKRRLKPPYDYSLVGDCRVPWGTECCMNKQDKERENK